MRALRILLQIICGLLSAVIVFVFLRAPGADFRSNLTMLAIFILFIVVLGPCWPSQDNMDRWSEKWNFRLPTDDPDVAKYVGNYLISAYCFDHAWDVYTNPIRELWRHEKTVFAIAGSNGVVAIWIFLALACLVYGAAAHAKSRRA